MPDVWQRHADPEAFRVLRPHPTFKEAPGHEHADLACRLREPATVSADDPDLPHAVGRGGTRAVTCLARQAGPGGGAQPCHLAFAARWPYRHGVSGLRA